MSAFDCIWLLHILIEMIVLIIILYSYDAITLLGLYTVQWSSASSDGYIILIFILSKSIINIMHARVFKDMTMKFIVLL